MPGPVPKRSTERRRRNKPEGGIARAANTVVDPLGPEIPVELGITDPLALAWYASLRTSGQAAYYTDSDWTSAWVVARAIEKFSERPAAGLMQAILQGMGNLLATEGDRRRVRMELERATDEDPEELAAVADFEAYQRKLGG